MQDMLSASNVTQIDRMPEKSEVLKARVPTDVRGKFEALAEREGLTVSALLRVVVENVVAGEGEVAAPRKLQSRSRREGKVTVRLAEDVRRAIDVEAKSFGTSVSTWAASLLRARYRRAPQPLPDDLPQVRRAFRKLGGVAVNANQMARALNRGALTGAGADVTAAEVRALVDEVGALRRELRAVATGRFRVQVPEDQHE